MSTIEDLKIPSITEMNSDEAIEHLRQLRLSRRTPLKKVTKAKPKVVKKMSKTQASELLRLLGE